MTAIIVNNLAVQVRLFRGLVKNPKFWIILSTDIVLIVLAYSFAYLLRFELMPHHELWLEVSGLLPLLLVIKIPCFYLFGLYRGMWRYTSMEDILAICVATFFSSAALLSLLLIGNRFAGFSRSVFILDFIFTFALIAAHRMAIRYVYQKSNGGTSHLPTLDIPEKKRLLLVGAGDIADKVIREVQDNYRLPYVIVGLVDDNPKKTGLRLHGIPVIGKVNEIKEHAFRINAQEILITIATLKGRQMKRLVALCQKTELPFKILPSIAELINGKVSIKTMRDISYKDLLGRAEVRLEQDKIGDYLTGKAVLITGAGGSIGSELCRQILKFAPDLIVLFDSNEENLYNVQMELRHEHHNVNAVTVLGRVQDLRLLDVVFRRYRPLVVFHTAAYKHVPLVERNPWQAVINNIVGTQLLLEASILFGVERFVLVSTDKAVRPTNVMGASKRVTELLMVAYSAESWDGHFSPAWMRTQRSSDPAGPQFDTLPTSHTTRFMGVRFGNVLGSSGSVVPLFKRQIEKGGPVTVTHPEVTRYFMSAEEAAQLILQAGSMAEGGEIFILKMGNPVLIANMARDLIKLTGREPETEIEIQYTGLRAGEKLYEELITDGEGIVDTPHEKIMVLRGTQVISSHVLDDHLEILNSFARELDSAGIKHALQEIVPEYIPDYTV